MVVTLMVLATISTVRSVVHIFLPDGGSSTIAGIVLPAATSGPIVFAFAWAGIYQLIWTGVEWVVLLRYRGLIPLLCLLMLFEQVALFLLPYFKPALSGHLAHIPPEAVGNKILLPVMVLLLLSSLFQTARKRGSP